MIGNWQNPEFRNQQSRIKNDPMTITEPRLKIAVFIDFDNVEIGVKSTIGGQFDVGPVLEAIKERGEIVHKVAYSDWKRAGDHSRLLTQHAIRMVQRNLTPGGDKNGADITMALDALEMAFTHDHINAFVIVGGDSDFISLVEKLKQYDRKVFVVGGRQFTSMTMQKNCHEFIAYENLVGARGRTAGRGKPAGTMPISEALPLVQRALKVLSDREATPQLGLLKSTLLQLDSAFSERDYGATSFRDFVEKLAEAGAVTLKHAGRSMTVEPRDEETVLEPSPPAVKRSAAAPAEDEDEMPSGPMQMAEGIRAVQQAFARGNPRWPMYVRHAKQFLRHSIEGFDERRYGFASLADLLRACAKEGVVRIERDRQGGMRVFPGVNLQRPAAVPEPAEVTAGTGDTAPQVEEVAAPADGEPIVEETATEPPIIDAETVEPAAEAVEEIVVEQPRRARKRKTATGGKKGGQRAAKSTGRSRRGRRGARARAVAADEPPST